MAEIVQLNLYEKSANKNASTLLILSVRFFGG